MNVNTPYCTSESEMRHLYSIVGLGFCIHVYGYTPEYQIHPKVPSPTVT